MSARWRCAAAFGKVPGIRSSTGAGSRSLVACVPATEGPDYQPPTAPWSISQTGLQARRGRAAVGLAEHELRVKVSADPNTRCARRPRRASRSRMPGSRWPAPKWRSPPVDEGLLALRGNDSWDLLHAMPQRAWGVADGHRPERNRRRRHYGRKAVAAGRQRRRQGRHARAVRHAAGVEGRISSTPGRGRGRGAAEQFAHQLPPRRHRRRRRTQRASAAAPTRSASRRICKCCRGCRRWCAKATASSRC